MKGFLFLCEGGLILLDENSKPVTSLKLKEASEFVRLRKGEATPALKEILEKASVNGFVTLTVDGEGESLLHALQSMGWNAEKAPTPVAEEFRAGKLRFMLEAGLAQSEEEAMAMIREAALELSKTTLRELSAKPDLQVMESIQALDEVDKTINLLTSRVREWYGLHFPEMSNLVDDGRNYCEILLKAGMRENINEEHVTSLGLTKAKARALLESSSSKGAPIRDVDLKAISSLAEVTLKMYDIRDPLARHVESTMNFVAPNLAAIAGATIGARLIAKAGGLEKLARLPSSTVQILGAEKALFRALRTGARPPKHGIIFQHEAIHSAPMWIRGKIARSLAGKMAIAARIDAFRGSKEMGIEDSLKARLEEIRARFKERPPPRVEKREEKKGRGEKRKGQGKGRQDKRSRRWDKPLRE